MVFAVLHEVNVEKAGNHCISQRDLKEKKKKCSSAADEEISREKETRVNIAAASGVYTVWIFISERQKDHTKQIRIICSKKRDVVDGDPRISL